MHDEATLNRFSLEAIVLDHRPPVFVARAVSLALCGFALLALLYASIVHMDVVASAQGRIVPAGRTKIVQPAEAGVVRAIHVRDGQAVKAGDVLVELDLTLTTADRERLAREAMEAEADVARLTTLVKGRSGLALPADTPPEVAENQRSRLAAGLAEHRARMAALDAEVARRTAEAAGAESALRQARTSRPLVERKHDMRAELARKGFIAETGLIETRLELIGAEKEVAIQDNRQRETAAALHAAVQQKAQAEAEHRARASAELADAVRRRESLRQELVKADQRRDYQTLRAPTDGIVQQLAVTTVGGVVTQAQPLLAVVPEGSPIEVEAQVLNKDIGQLRPGQRAIVKVETYDFTRYGHVEGEVQWVGTDAVTDQKLGPVFPVRVRLAARETPNSVGGQRGLLVPGMSVTADIKVAERRMIEYFLSPLLRYKEESLRER